VHLLLDTQIFVWLSTNDRRLSKRVLSAIVDEATELYTSSVVAWEFVDLEKRGRFPPLVRFETLLAEIEFKILDFPAEAWRLIDSLPKLHRDPVDRMLIAHAIHADLTLVTSDKIMRDYPVKSLW
jgi:PIN domain nuclease of toxin-antitoxin system